MKKSMKFLMSAAVALLLGGAAGCRNHIKDIDHTMTDYERTTLRDIAVAQLLERDEDNASFRFKVSGTKEVEVKVFQVRNTISRYTPYQGLREFYEVPMGLFLLPVGLASHVVSVASLGIFPYSWCWELDCLSFSALNPFLNVESNTRFVDEPSRSTRDQVDARTETDDYVMHQTDVSFRIGKSTAHKVTDNSGVVQFDLLDTKGKSMLQDNYDRKLRVYVGSSPTAAYSWVVPRYIRRRIVAASKVIAAYHKNPTAGNLRQAISKLEESKFSHVAYLLEQQELEKRGQDFRKEYDADEDKK
jgi:hypothetical protein